MINITLLRPVSELGMSNCPVFIPPEPTRKELVLKLDVLSCVGL